MRAARVGTPVSLSDVAEALIISSDLDSPLHLPGAVAKHAESSSRSNDYPNYGKEFRGND